MKNLLFTITFFFAAVIANATTYYVSASGNDAGTGTSTSDPWQTLAKVNQFTFAPGDVILLQGGATFYGNISKENIGNITFSSYGTGKATIASDLVRGIYLGNSGDITITNLIIRGAGYNVTAMNVCGIDFYMYSTVTKTYGNIVIDNVEIYGYGGKGVSFYTDSDTYGYNNVRVTNSLFHDNGIAGFQIMGSWDNTRGLIRIIHTNIYVGNCKAYYNYGRSDLTTNWSGSGILVSGTNGGVVEYCEAYENGKDNANPSGGPIGIWMDDSKYITIQNCVSHNNRGGLTQQDGGGFDIDGGCFGGVIQNCDSYQNEGCGYGLFQWATGNKWSNDTIRNNTSTNDARNPKYGAFSFWGASSSYMVTNAQVYGNKVTLDQAGYVLSSIGNNFLNVAVHDNAYCITAPGVYYTTLSSNITLTNNSFPCLVLSIKTGSFNVKRIL